MIILDEENHVDPIESMLLHIKCAPKSALWRTVCLNSADSGIYIYYCCKLPIPEEIIKKCKFLKCQGFVPND